MQAGLGCALVEGLETSLGSRIRSRILWVAHTFHGDLQPKAEHRMYG